MRPFRPLALLLGVSLLSGCIETFDEAPVGLAPTAEDRASPAYRACVAAIASTVGVSQADVAVFEFLFSQAGSTVRATVAGAEAPWRCLSSNDGVVQDVTYTGSEGFL